ncbi:MAG: helix-turn-helix transcriptional regulator [Hamadaea sp.]|nr:helix-turn-helix transcriptional regulator [Hamadaea sp.]
MAFEGSPAVARHRLRLALRKAREAKDLTQGQVADALDWSLSKLQRIEGGENSISPTDTRALLAELDVTEPATVDALITQARMARRRGRWDEARFRDLLTAPTRALLEYEAEATEIRNFQTVLIPGPLQTPDLAEHVMAGWSDELSDQERAIRLEVRLSRRDRIFARPNPPVYRLLIDESVLHRVLGGPRVFGEQLRSLLRDQQAGLLEIRVLPFSMTAIVALGLPFVVLSLGGDEDSVLYRESHLVDEIVQTPEKVHRHLSLFDQLWDQGHGKAATEALITHHADILLGNADQGTTST